MVGVGDGVVFGSWVGATGRYLLLQKSPGSTRPVELPTAGIANTAATRLGPLEGVECDPGEWWKLEEM